MVYGAGLAARSAVEVAKAAMDEQADRLQRRAFRLAVAMWGARIAYALAVGGIALTLTCVVLLLQPYTGLAAACGVAAGMALFRAAALFYVAARPFLALIRSDGDGRR